MKLPLEFFLGDDVVTIAQQLLGKRIICIFNEQRVSARIVETEAYSFKEKGCHAYNYKRTERTSTMFKPGGCAYVYLCYGVHHLFNVVTNITDQPEAVLIRAIEPLEGLNIMELRRSNTGLNLTSGPGKLTQAMGITTDLDGISLLGDLLWIEDADRIVSEQIVSKPRIGIDYAQEDALLPWRFYIRGNKYISRP